jgi:hypothetical protein
MPSFPSCFRRKHITGEAYFIHRQVYIIDLHCKSISLRAAHIPMRNTLSCLLFLLIPVCRYCYHFLPKPLYFSCRVLYSNPEQSRRPRVKCHRDGEFARRTKDFSTMRSPHPLLHMGSPPLCSNDTRSGEWSAVLRCFFPWVNHIACNSRTRLCREFCIYEPLGSRSLPSLQ